jgi:diguanylate cyclase (GGDEF)-like protein
MSSIQHSLFDSAVRITEMRNKKSLEKALLATLSDFIIFDTLFLLRVPDNPENEYLEIAQSLPESAIQDKLKPIFHEYGDQRIEIDTETSLCIKKGETILGNQGADERTLVPIIVNNVVSGILDIYGYSSTASSDKLLQGFTRIYSNFQAIINDNEHDTLTGLLNRKTFDIQLSELIANSPSMQDTSLSTTEERRISADNTCHWIGILDIDYFKRINDNFGHVYGDEVLLLFSDLMRKAFRSSDLLFRYGGEEFVVALAPTTEEDAFNIFDRFREKLAAFVFPQVGQITVSIGMVKVQKLEHAATLLEHADKALYYAKENGRNQVRNYHELIKNQQLKEHKVNSEIELF